MEEKIIVIFCTKKDFFQARICVASIRYYYPHITLYLVKDVLQGQFSSKELEESFNVKVLDLGIKEFGWGAAKIHMLLSEKFSGKRVMMLDADIVFVGNFLDDLYEKTKDIDFVVSAEFFPSVDDDAVKRTYFDYEEIKAFEPSYKYPGFVFNTGQMVVKTGKIAKEDVASYFDKDKFPYYKNMKLTPFADQSILNIILGRKLQANEITLSPQHFMLWSDGPETTQLDINKVADGKEYPYLIHYAGSLKNAALINMKRVDILNFFEDYYYAKIAGARVKRAIRRFPAIIEDKKKFFILSVKAFVNRNRFASTFRNLLQNR